ncbi:MAG: guanylate kinase [Patescibacteria group bacterium]
MATLFVITGPSGAGKDSVIQAVAQAGQPFNGIITTTSRSLRKGEEQNKSYHFISRPEFQQKIDSGEMVEWAEVYGNLYGSTKQEVDQALTQDGPVIVKVDPQGARTFKKLYPEAVAIFVMPPSFEFLEKRLINRATDKPEIIKKRLELAKKELQNLLDWDFLVVNDEGKLQDAAQEVVDIMQLKLKK